MIGLGVVVGARSLSSDVITGREIVFEVAFINGVVGFVAMYAYHRGYEVSSATALRIDVVGKRNGGIISSGWWSNFLLHNQRIDSANTGDGFYDQDLCENVVVRFIQTLEKARNILHMFVFVNGLDKIAGAKGLNKNTMGVGHKSPSLSHIVLSSMKY